MEATETLRLAPHIADRIRLLDHTVEILMSRQVWDQNSRWYGGFLDPLRLLAEPWHAAGGVDVMSAVLAEPASRHFKSQRVLEAALAAIDYVNRCQYPNGTIDAYFVGDMQAAPNVAFVSRMLCRAEKKLSTLEENDDILDLRDRIRRFLSRAGAAMIDRRAYTASDRWVIADALLQLNELIPNPKLVDRAMRYLDEGIDINEDGMYSERSTFHGLLTNEALISIGELTGDSRYHDYVARNLELVAYLIQPNGEDAYQFSARQDVVVPGVLVGGDDVFRYMAAKTRNGLFASMADLLTPSSEEIDAIIAQEKETWSAEIPDDAVTFPSLKYSWLGPICDRGKLLSSWAYCSTGDIQRLPLPTTYRKVFPASRLVRYREDGVAASVMAMQPNIFSLHAGDVVLEGFRIRYLYHNWKSFIPLEFAVQESDYVLLGRFLGTHEGPKFPEEDADLFTVVTITPERRKWRFRVTINGQPMVPVQLEFAVRPSGRIVRDGVSEEVAALRNHFVGGDFELVGKRGRIRFRGVPRRVHRQIDSSGPWMGNIPMVSLYTTAFSPCELTFEIEGEWDSAT